MELPNILLQAILELGHETMIHAVCFAKSYYINFLAPGRF